MQHPKQPYEELERARQAIEKMRGANSLDDFEEAWKEFLRRLERAWNKAVNHFGKSPKWGNWHGKYVQVRRKDQLLSYLVNARGADEHTVTEITQHQHATMAIWVKPGQSFRINKAGFDADGKPIIDVEGDPDIRFTTEKVKLLPVTNRGVKYEVPTTHLSQPLDPENPIEIAQRGLDFYTDFLKSADEFFVRPDAA